MEELIVKFAGILWGPPTMVLIFGVQYKDKIFPNQKIRIYT